MPVCRVHLLALQPNTSISHFQSQLSKHLSPAPLVVARVIRWIVLPTSIDAAALLTHPWDLLIIQEGAQGQLPEAVASHVRASYTLQAGVPSALTKNFDATNARILHPREGDVPPLTGTLDNPRMASDSQDLEMSAELRKWVGGWDPLKKRGAVSMLNLLAFKEGMHAEYLKYGKAFADRVGSSRGGNAKLVGKVVGSGEGDKENKWHEIALAHYPSIWHFADMLSSKDYQDVNHKHRVGSLQDTCILFTSELELPGDNTNRSRL